jgi:hypothetical protein
MALRLCTLDLKVSPLEFTCCSALHLVNEALLEW